MILEEDKCCRQRIESMLLIPPPCRLVAVTHQKLRATVLQSQKQKKKTLPWLRPRVRHGYDYFQQQCRRYIESKTARYRFCNLPEPRYPRNCLKYKKVLVIHFIKLFCPP